MINLKAGFCVLVLAIGLSGCAAPKAALNVSKSSPITTLKKKYSSENLSGTWKWQAKQGTHIVSQGELILRDQNGLLEGSNKVFIPNSLIEGRKTQSGNASEVVMPISGKRDKYKLTFDAYDEKGEVLTSNTAFVSEFGTVMVGKGKQTLKVEKGEIYRTTSTAEKGKQSTKSLGKSHTIEYTWKATRF